MSNTIEEIKRLQESARKHEEEARASFQRSDTDGALSQWAGSVNARLDRLQAAVLQNGGRGRFIGLYEGDRRVPARMVQVYAPFRTGYSFAWEIKGPDIARYERQWIPVGERSRVQKKLGLAERWELAPAKAVLTGSGSGLAGAASVTPTLERTGDEWGQDAELAPEQEES